MAPRNRQLFSGDFRAHGSQLSSMRKLIKSKLAAHIDDSKLFDVQEAVGEAAGNAIDHLNPGREKSDENTPHTFRIHALMTPPTAAKEGLLKIIVSNKHLGKGTLDLETCKAIAAKEKDAIDWTRTLTQYVEKQAEKGALPIEQLDKTKKKQAEKLEKILGGGRQEGARGLDFMEGLADKLHICTNEHGEVETHLSWNLPKKTEKK